MTQASIFLLVRADDIGFSHAANAACMDVFTNGICRSVELMAPGPWFPEAVRMLKAHPHYDVGVHLTLTCEWDNLKWRPLSGASSITNADGYFYRAFRKSDHYPDEITLEASDWMPVDLEQEARAQIEMVRKHIPWVSHLTTHMGGLRDDPNFQSVVDKLATEYDLAVDVRAEGFERFRGFGENSQALSPAEKAATLRQSLETLPPGRWLHVDHPAYDTPETRAIHHIGYEGVAVDRQGVVEAWTDADVRAIIARRGIRLVSYADVRQGRL
ncbi:MAG: ChbG/HpnK family deacetylase [Caldilineaceae bacterium]|nr:ChbG/HpnK family deacetylase [Caldilineaceae bacterium]